MRAGGAAKACSFPGWTNCHKKRELCKNLLFFVYVWGILNKSRKWIRELLAFCSFPFIKFPGTCCVLKKIESIFCVKRLNRTFKFISRHRLDDNLSDGSAFFPLLSISVNGHSHASGTGQRRRFASLHKFVCFKARKLGKKHLAAAAELFARLFNRTRWRFSVQ